MVAAVVGAVGAHGGRGGRFQPPRHGRIPQETVVPGQDYRIVGEGKGFTHIHASPDGEWWISDDNKTADIYIGSVRTARYKLLHRSGATFGSAQYAHPHPFFLGDGKSVGWNSDVTGVPQIYVARLPEGFLDSLR